MSFIKISITISVVLGALFFGFKNQWRLIDLVEYERSVTSFIALKGADEYVIAELQSHDTFSKRQCSKKILGNCIGYATVDISFEPHYKYYVKLAELNYVIDGDTLVFEAPKLYLSTPVGYQSAHQNTDCDKTLLGDCNKTRNSLMTELSADLEAKGLANMPSVYEKAAKSLADNFYQFASNNETGFLIKKIAVRFASEGSQSQRVFSYNKSYCGKEPCTIELNLGEGLLFTLR